MQDVAVGWYPCRHTVYSISFCNLHAAKFVFTGVQKAQVRCTQDCLKILQRGDQNRVFAATEMNAHSSRSHAIVIVTVFKQRKRPTKRMENGREVIGQYVPVQSLCCVPFALSNASWISFAYSCCSCSGCLTTQLLAFHPEYLCRTTTMGRMFMVDLAGSERLKKSKSVGVRAQEAKAINLSLHTLGLCVHARSDPNATHVPFRDSKLTRLLQESLGGNAKTSMIIAVSDVKEHCDETFQSCLFGSRAILVRTAPTINHFLDFSSLNNEIASQLQVQPSSACH